MASGVEDRATHLPLAARRLVDQVEVWGAVAAIELLVAARAVDVRGSSPLGRGTVAGGDNFA